MRILSQNVDGIGVFDVPYELCVVSTGKRKKTGNPCIYVRCNLFGECSVVAAEYSSPEKARKAMDMLHEAYCGAVYMKHADYEIDNIDLSQVLEKKIREEMLKPHFLDVKIKNPVIECKVFRFPADDEVEV